MSRSRRKRPVPRPGFRPCVEALEERRLLSASLVKDINAITGGAFNAYDSSRTFAVVGDTVYFAHVVFHDDFSRFLAAGGGRQQTAASILGSLEYR